MGAVEFFKSSSILEFNAYIYIFKDLLQDLKLKEGEFALSKDTTVSLWTEYRTWFGGIQLQEVSGGDFVIISDDLYDEFETFKRRRCIPMWTEHSALSKL